MILTDREIQSALANHQIGVIPPPSADAYSSTSLDLKLASRALAWSTPPSGVDLVIDPGSDGFMYSQVSSAYTKTIDIPADGHVLAPQGFLLGWTIEEVFLPAHARIAARVEGKSSLARLGLGVHITAPTIHAGFKAQIQLEILNHGTMPIRLRTGMRICQLIFEQTLGTPDKGYSGMFQNQSSATGVKTV
jgi:dCTP deaminase